MTTNDLIYQLINKGIKLIPQAGGGLDVGGPASALTPELIDALRQHKATILRRMRIIERSDAEPVRRRLDRLISTSGLKPTASATASCRVPSIGPKIEQPRPPTAKVEAGGKLTAPSPAGPKEREMPTPNNVLALFRSIL